jgi:fatty acid desaturase
MFMHVPCYNLPKVHRLLKKSGTLDRMLTAPGYAAVLAMASSKPDPRAA